MTNIGSAPSERYDPSTDRKYQMFIDGAWSDGSTGETFQCVDPFTGRTWGQVPVASPEDVDTAVRAARRAFDEDGWPSTPPAQRAALLRKLGALIEAEAEDLARTQIHENGKLITEMLPGAQNLASICYYFAGLAESTHGDSVISSVPGVTSFTRREAIGVVAAITPWNSPLGLLGLKLFPALAAGCAVVAKPSEVTPTSTLRLVELCAEAGFPDGVVNVVTGFGPVGQALVEHRGVDKITFTGSSATGEIIAAKAATRLARLSLELGGKSPNIVFNDADLDNALHGVMAGVFGASGQTCMAGSRVLVQEDIHDDFVSALSAKAARLRLGDPLSTESQVGPVAYQKQFDKVLSYMDIGREEGAEVVVGGGRASAHHLRDGLFVEPTVFSGVHNRSRLAQEEIFGPVASIIPFKDEDHATAIANDIPFGLVAGIWTENVGRAHRMIGRIRSGTVWVNTYRIGSAALPYGGIKESGVGREGGPASLHAYTEEKTVWIDHGNRQTFGR
jgi:acyl-CoA reductase-like NAD-dependent aldehyde dehydrogenase